MVEYYCWATICETTSEIDAGRISFIIKEINKHFSLIAATHRVNEFRAINGSWTLILAGNTNHRGKDLEDAFHIFDFVAGIAPGSYGLIYIRDDEDSTGRVNEFRVWRLARGKLEEMKDQLLSPCVPVIEAVNDRTADF